MLNEVVIWVGSFVILTSFILSYCICWKKDKPKYLKYFFAIPLISFCITINTIINLYFHLLDKVVFYQIQLLICFLDLFIWCYIFLLINKSKFDSSIIISVFSIIFFLTSSMFIINEFNRPNFQIICLFNISKSILCVHYYYKLFKTPPVYNLKTDPVFWIINGLFFYSCLSIPFYSFHTYIMIKFSEMLAVDVLAFSNMLIIVMHFFFIKAYLCSIRMHRT